MSIRYEDLPERARRQVAGKLLQGQSKKKKQNKYHNLKAERPGYHGRTIRFDSQAEARKYDELMLLQRAGQIRKLRLQPEFTLQEAYTTCDGYRVRAIRYRADFSYEEQMATGAWETVVVDVKSKGTRTEKYSIKKKMMQERLGITIVEVE